MTRDSDCTKQRRAISRSASLRARFGGRSSLSVWPSERGGVPMHHGAVWGSIETALAGGRVPARSDARPGARPGAFQERSQHDLDNHDATP